MARYRRGLYRKRKTRNRIYGGLAVLILVVVIFFTFFHKGGDKIAKKEPVGFFEAKPVKEAKQAPETPRVIEPPKVVAAEPKTVRQPALEPTLKATLPVLEVMTEAAALINSKPAKIIEARDILDAALKEIPMNQSELRRVKSQLSKLADMWLFSRKVYPQDKLCDSYKVASGEMFSEIGKQYKVPHELLMRMNTIARAELLRAGDTIKVINGPFHAKIYLSSFTMDLYLQKTFVKSYKVGIGQTGKRTPTGLWRVKHGGKLIEPPWPDPVSGKILYAGDPDYALGSRWIGLEGLEGEAKGRTGFGIHGTKEPETIGTASSRGCIRLHNGHAIEVYDLLVPIHSKVRVVE